MSERDPTLNLDHNQLCIRLSLYLSDQFHFSPPKQQVLEYALDRAEVKSFSFQSWAYL